jgi:PleD family two-component response regulator
MPVETFRLRNLIFCEDDDDDRFLFKEIVQEYNPQIKVEFLSGGITLMHFLKHFIPDLLFLALEMPFKNGLECLLEIRQSESLRHLPVIIFSSTTRPANIQTAYEMGANLFLIKSPTFSEYDASLRSVLNLDWSKPDVIKEQYCVNGSYVAFS